VLIVIEPRPSELNSRGRPQMSPVTLGSAKEPVVNNSRFLDPSYLPAYLSTQHTDLKQGHIFAWIFRTLCRKSLCNRHSMLQMFIINKLNQLKYTELLLRHVSAIDSRHLQVVPVTTEIYSLRMAINIWYRIYDMIYLLTAIGLSPGGCSTVHIYTQTIHRTIQNKQYIEQHNNFGRVRAVPRLG
jgi:hypothetical protein